MPVAVWFKQLFEHFGWEGKGAWLLFILVCLTANIAIALITWNLLEKHALRLKKLFVSKPVETSKDSV
jgi:peptidoglycan/LPS O-acetylase OafA/YrhL